jgi:hypothetical protein
MSEDRSGYVYLLEAEDGSCFKIGRSKVVSRRLTQIRPNLPFKVRIVATIWMRDCWELEKYLHETYAHFRMNGEWFQLPPPDVTRFKMLALMQQAVGLCWRLDRRALRFTYMLFDISADAATRERLHRTQGRAIRRMARRAAAFYDYNSTNP